MSGIGSVIFNPTLTAAAAALGVGFAAVWANPRRPVNRAFFLASAHVATWLTLFYLTVRMEEGLPWLRATTAVGAFFPLQLWLVRDAICDPGPLRTFLLRRWYWVALVTALGMLPFTYWFIPAHSTAEQEVYGSGYYVYMLGIVSAYVAVAAATVQAVRVQTGVKRLELRILLIGGCIAAIVIVALMVGRTVSGVRWLVGLQPLVILVFYVGMVVAITTGRVFDARQILLLALKRVVLVGVVSLAAYLLDRLLTFWLNDYLALYVTVGLALWFAAEVGWRLDRWMQFYPEAEVARQAAHAVALRENRVERLERGFADVLKGWGQTDLAIVLYQVRGDSPGRFAAGTTNDPVWEAMRDLGWATPERLARERTSPARVVVDAFLQERRLGALAYADGPAIAVLVGVGQAASRRPFTYPQVTQLMELATIIEGAFERAQLFAKVQHAEQLATVGLLGASLAHEIRNPLVTIKTFVQLLPAHYQDAAFREKFFRLIADEVNRIDRLTEQLLDLAAPRTYAATVVHLHPILRASLDLVATKAAHRNVQLVADFAAEPDVVYTDAAAAKQVMLNLCFNAIQALETQDERPRCVWVTTRKLPNSVEVAVTDTGPGIAPEVLPRLFKPFQTTKSSGFGLGLAICSDILTNLNASISVDPPAPGRGATFRVIFPCQPSSS
ncbi:ATP-binding protein [Opitutus sp. ER46]|uniref:sensor histidine kinase n=1 Tax=Opitutus sp. ER46 TaxID=2161864 RepID=UPI000D301A7F|nr:ATP-binding protein [Opitutus sp. ER46]PTX92530.1 hypothetical protein DB354_14465 [Opitutus sp. ER46]